MIVDRNLVFTLILLFSCASCNSDSAPEISRLASALESLRIQPSKKVVAEEQQETESPEAFFFEHPDKLQKLLEEVQQKIKYMIDQAQGLVDKGQADAMILALQDRLGVFERYRTQLEKGAGSQDLIMETFQVVSSNTDMLSKMSEVLANTEPGNVAAAFIQEGNLSAELKEQKGVSSRQTEGCANRQQEEEPTEAFFFEHPDKLQKFLEEVQQKIKYMMDQAQGLVDKGQADAMISALQGRLGVFERYRTQLEKGAGSQGLIMETLQVVSSNTDMLSKMSEVLANAELENKSQNLYKKESRLNTFFSGNTAAAFVQKQISQQLKSSGLQDVKEFNVDPDYPVSQELMD